MQKIPLWALSFFMAWVASAAEQPGSGKFYVALAARSRHNTFFDQEEQRHSAVAPVPKQPCYQPAVNFYVHASAHNRYESNLHNLQQEYERERYFQCLKQSCAYNQLDPTWASPQTHDVRTRCTTINFRNGPIWSYQRLKPSPLPPNFYDSFGSLYFFERLLWGNKPTAKYHDYFLEKLNNQNICHCKKSPEAYAYARAQMRNWSYYEYEGFRAFLRQLSVYEEYIFEIAAQLQHDAEFASLVREASPTAATYIPQEAQRLRALQQERAEQEWQRKDNHLRNQQQQCAQELFVQQKERLVERAIVWETTHPERAVAYRKVLAENGAQSQQAYCLSAQAQVALRQMNLAPGEYSQLTGNALQHELMQEIITGIEQNAQISPQVMGSTAQLLHKHSLYSFGDARQANAMGDCEGTAQLIDLGNQLLECCKAFVNGLVDGIKAGAVDAVVGTLEMVQHPIETVQACAKTANMLLRLAYDYIPLLPDNELSLEEYDAYLHQCGAAERKWDTAYTQLKQKWRDTPTPDLMYQVTRGATSMATNIFVAHSCTKLVSSLVRALRPVVAEAVTKLKRKVSQLELQQAVPGFLLLQKQSQLSRLCEYGAKLGFNHEEIFAAVKTICNSEFGEIDQFERALIEFGGCPGVERAIKETLVHCSAGHLARAKGAYNELRSALFMKDQGQRILAFDYAVEYWSTCENRMKKYIADFITYEYLVECKDVHWQSYSLDAEKGNRLKNQLRNASAAAKSQNKRVLLLSRHGVPPDLHIINQCIFDLENIDILIG